MRFHSDLLNEIWEKVRTPFVASESSVSQLSPEQELVARIGPWMNELREDLLTPEGRYVRDVYVLPNRQVKISAAQAVLSYYEDVYPQIGRHLHELVQLGLLTEVMRMSPDFRVYRISQQLFNILINS
jgi:hypothetical protein